MASHPDIFHNPTKSIPQHKNSPPNEVRIGLDKSDLGARKSHISDIHESIRGGESGVRAIAIPKPSLKDREEWLNNFDASLRERAKKGMPQKLGGKDVTHLEYAPGFDHHTFAIQAAATTWA